MSKIVTHQCCLPSQTKASAFPGEFHSTLFEKFSDAGRKGLQGEPTVSLGMSIVKTIIDWHQGKIWFDSKENAGTGLNSLQSKCLTA